MDLYSSKGQNLATATAFDKNKQCCYVLNLGVVRLPQGIGTRRGVENEASIPRSHPWYSSTL